MRAIIVSHIKTLNSVRYAQATLGWMIRNKQWALLKLQLERHEIVVSNQEDADTIFQVKESALFTQLFEEFAVYFDKAEEDNEQKKYVNSIKKAVSCDNSMAVEYLYQHGYQSPNDIRKLVEDATKNNNFEIIRLLIKNSPLKYYTLSAITTAIQNNHLNNVQYLLNNGTFDTSIFYDHPTGLSSLSIRETGSFDPLSLASKYAKIKTFKVVLRHIRRKKNKDFKPSDVHFKEANLNGKVLKYIFDNYHPSVSVEDLIKMLEDAVTNDSYDSAKFLFEQLKKQNASAVADEVFLTKLIKTAFSKGNLRLFNMLNGDRPFDFSVYSYSQVKAISSFTKFIKFVKLGTSPIAVKGGLRLTHTCFALSGACSSKRLFNYMLANAKHSFEYGSLLINGQDISVTFVQRCLENSNYYPLARLIKDGSMPTAEFDSMWWLKYTYTDKSVSVLNWLFENIPISGDNNTAALLDLMTRCIKNNRPAILKLLLDKVLNTTAIKDYLPFVDIAFQLPCSDFLEQIIKKGDIKKITQPQSFKNVRSISHLECLVKHNITFDAKYAIYVLISAGNVEAVEFMLRGDYYKFQSPAQELLEEIGKCGNVRVMQMIYSYMSHWSFKPNYEIIHKSADASHSFQILEFINHHEPVSYRYRVRGYLAKKSTFIINKYIKFP